MTDFAFNSLSRWTITSLIREVESSRREFLENPDRKDKRSAWRLMRDCQQELKRRGVEQ